MAGHGGAGSSAVQAQSNRIQSSVVKTMIFVSAFYALADAPIQIYYLILLTVHSNLTLLESGYYAALFISFFYICANPFIYAVKFDPVKGILLRLIPCKTNIVVPIQSIENTGGAGGGGGGRQFVTSRA